MERRVEHHCRATDQPCNFLRELPLLSRGRVVQLIPPARTRQERDRAAILRQVGEEGSGIRPPPIRFQSHLSGSEPGRPGDQPEWFALGLKRRRSYGDSERLADGSAGIQEQVPPIGSGRCCYARPGEAG